MKLTHYLQLGLAVVAAAAGAAVPLIVSPMTPAAWGALIVAESLAVAKALSVQSEVAGDKSVKS